MKRCRACGEVKPLDEFYPHRKMRDGRLNHCKPCEVERSAARQRRKRSRQAPVAGWSLDGVQTMPRHEMLKWAASRFGLVDPCPDDVLSGRWPQYGRGDRIHVEGYHADYEAVFRMATTRVRIRLCKVCGSDISDLNGNRRYCGLPCQEQAEAIRRRTTNGREQHVA